MGAYSHSEWKHSISAVCVSDKTGEGSGGQTLIIHRDGAQPSCVSATWNHLGQKQDRCWTAFPHPLPEWTLEWAQKTPQSSNPTPNTSTYMMWLDVTTEFKRKSWLVEHRAGRQGLYLQPSRRRSLWPPVIEPVLTPRGSSQHIQGKTWSHKGN